MNRYPILAGCLAVAAACTPPAGRTASERPAPEASLRHIAARTEGGLQSVVLEPIRVARVIGPTPVETLQIEVGAIYAFKGEGAAGRHNLGMVFEVSHDTVAAIYRHDRQLLLEMDGRVFLSPPPSPALYSVHPEGQGVTEVIMVPVTPTLLRWFVNAKDVRGRLGRWTTLEFSPDERARFSALLAEIPPGADFGGEDKPAPRLPKALIASP